MCNHRTRLPFMILTLLMVFSLWPPKLGAADYVPDEIIVRYKEKITASSVVRSLSTKGAQRMGGTKRLNFHFVRLPQGTSVEEAIEEYEKDPNVLYAGPNYIVHALLTPNDPDYSEQWGLHNTAQPIGPSNVTGTDDADIDAPDAWDIETGSSGTVIAVLDTGIDFEHDDLDGQLWNNTGEILGNTLDDDNNDYADDINGWDFVNRDNDPDDDNHHGTHVAGIIGAEGNNLTGVTGVNWDVRIMVLKVLDGSGNGEVDNIISAIEYAVDNGAQVINLSLGFGTSNPENSSFDQGLYDMIQEAANEGVLVVAAAGNNSSNGVQYPARFNLDNIISVTATDADDNLAQLDTNIFAATNNMDVDLGAPGLNIYSTFVDTATVSDDYNYLNGTSQAAAFVSGTAALLLSRDATLTPDQIKARILNSVDPVTDTDITNNTVSGGRLNAGTALTDQKDIEDGTTATLDHVVIVPYTASMNVGETRQFTLEGETVTDWSSTNQAVGTIDSSTGLFTAESAGTCQVEAVAGSETYTSSNILIKDIVVSASATSLKKGGTLSFSASGGTSPYTWSSSNEAVAVVSSSGAVNGVDKGQVTITATDAKGFFGTSETITVTSTKKSGNCFIATAAFGSSLEPGVRILQRFRDRYLLTNGPGRYFVELYYRYSPPAAEMIAESPLLRAAVRIALIPPILFSSFMIKTGISWTGLFFVMLALTGCMAGFLVGKRKSATN